MFSNKNTPFLNQTKTSSNLISMKDGNFTIRTRHTIIL